MLKVSVTVAPTIAGPVTVRMLVTKAIRKVYVDPVIDVAGKSLMVESVQTFSPTTGGSYGTPAFATRPT